MIDVHSLGTKRMDLGSPRITPAARKQFGFLFYLAVVPANPETRVVLRRLSFPNPVRT